MYEVVKKLRRFEFPGWVVVAVSAAFYSYDVLLRVAPSLMIRDLMSHYAISASTLSLSLIHI